MRSLPLYLATLLAATPSLAQTRNAHPAAARPATHPAPTAPKAIGKFDDWTAATHQEGGQTVCYAFTRAATSTPAAGWPG